MARLTPREAATSMEIGRVLPPGDDERVIGYGVVGLPFTSGHYLVLRDFHAASFSPPYRSVWHRDPQGDWRVYGSGDPAQTCPRFIGAALVEPATVTPVDITWIDDFTLRVFIDDVLDWTVRCRPTTITTMMSGMSVRMPISWWSNPLVQWGMGRMASRVLRAGRMRLKGNALPNGQSYEVAPRRIWEVTGSSAVVRGEDIGAIGPLADQDSIGDFPLPQRGFVFADGFGHFESFDPARHAPVEGAR